MILNKPQYTLRCSFAVVLGVTVTGFLAANYLLIRGNAPISTPVHHDDYTALGLSPSLELLFSPRPTSMIISSLLSSTGIAGYYLAINMFAALYAALVFFFVQLLFDGSLRMVSLLFFAALAFASPASLEFGKYIGLVSNSSSGILGALALICFIKAFRKGGMAWPMGAICLYGLTALAKEDFLSIPLALVVYLSIVEKSDTSGRRTVGLVSGCLLVLAIFAVDSIFSASPFLAGITGVAGSPYSIGFYPSSIVRTSLTYLFGSAYLMIISLLSIVTVVALAVCKRQKVMPASFVLVTVLLLVGPYSLLPNHVYSYYTYTWTTWECALVSIGTPLVLEQCGRNRRLLLQSIFCGLCFVPLYVTYPEKQAVAHWYRVAADYNRSVLRSLEAMKPVLEKEEVVGIEGVDGVLSPFSRNEGTYLKKRLGLKNRWVVFVSGDSMFFATDKEFSRGSQKPITVILKSRMCEFSDMLILEIARDGTASARRGCERRGNSPI
jgi:hypothetical protein